MTVLNKLYNKSSLAFALVFIGSYCLLGSLANMGSETAIIENSAQFIVNFILSLILLIWIIAGKRAETFGLCKSKAPAKELLWYIPLVIFVSLNLFSGLKTEYDVAETVFYVLSMLCVGFLEEIIFRGLLFKALCEQSLKTAVIVSSVTFGAGHILNLFNGSNMQPLNNLLQIIGAIACGFMFTMIFLKTGSLISCIIAHSLNNILFGFCVQGELAFEKQMIFTVITLAVTVFYTVFIAYGLVGKRGK